MSSDLRRRLFCALQTLETTQNNPAFLKQFEGKKPSPFCFRSSVGSQKECWGLKSPEVQGLFYMGIACSPRARVGSPRVLQRPPTTKHVQLEEWLL